MFESQNFKSASSNSASDTGSLQQIFTAANLGYLIWHPDPSMCEVSDLCWTLIGAEPGNQLGYSDWCSRLSCEAGGFSWLHLDRFVERSLLQPARIDLDATLPDGSSVRLRMVAEASTSDDVEQRGQIIAVVSCVSPLRRTVESLIEANDRFDSIAQGARVGLWHRNLVTGESYWSKRFWEILGVRKSSANPPVSLFYEYVHPDDRGRMIETRRAHLEHGAPYDLEVRAWSDDSQYRWFKVRGEVIRDACGKPLRFGGSLEDITEKRRADKQLEAGRRFQKLIMNTMEDLIFVKDEQSRICEANDAFLDMFPEETRCQVIGNTSLQGLSEAQRERALEGDRRAFEEGLSETDECIYFPNGGRRSLWMKKVRFEDQDGTRYVLGYARDVTDRKTNERALRTANLELEEFAYRVSHDLRSPLLSSLHLLGHVGDALAKGDIQASQDILEVAKNSLNSLNDKARDILDIHRVRYGELTAEAIDIEELVENILKRHRLDHEDLDLRASYALNAVPFVDAYGLNLMLENLISNAAKYRDVKKDSCWVAVDVQSNKRQLKISVTDNGLGIPSANRAKLFGMFQRFHPRKSFGSGLGLYMTRQWAERMGGALTARHLDLGTEFLAIIPQQKAANQSANPRVAGGHGSSNHA